MATFGGSGTVVAKEMFDKFNQSTTAKGVAISVAATSLAAVLAYRWYGGRGSSSLSSPPSSHAARADAAKRLRASRRARKASTSSSRSDGYLLGGSRDWTSLHRQLSSASEAVDAMMSASVAPSATLVDGTTITPQQLGLMGLEALDTVVDYWEDALEAFTANRRQRYSSGKSLTSAKDLTKEARREEEENAFKDMLDKILEEAYQLQDTAESLFIYESSLLNRKRRRPAPTSSAVSVSGHSDHVDVTSGGDVRGGLSVSSADLDQESFVSAQDTIADLADFDDLNDIIADADPSQHLYLNALDLLEKEGIAYRYVRTAFVGCDSDSDYLAKTHCIRQAFDVIMSDSDRRGWWVDAGRNVFSGLLVKCGKDSSSFCASYDDLVAWLADHDHLQQMETELKSRNVRSVNFYDVALDYILIDSFEDLDSPPSSVVAVMRNRWLSNGFKESALQTAIWSVFQAKRRLLMFPRGFKAQFYNLSETLTPVLAWGFFGPDENLNSLMVYFKTQVLAFIRDMYSSGQDYASAEALADCIMKAATARFDSVVRRLEGQADDEDEEAQLRVEEAVGR